MVGIPKVFLSKSPMSHFWGENKVTCIGKVLLKGIGVINKVIVHVHMAIAQINKEMFVYMCKLICNVNTFYCLFCNI